MAYEIFPAMVATTLPGILSPSSWQVGWHRQPLAALLLVLCSGAPCLSAHSPLPPPLHLELLLALKPVYTRHTFLGLGVKTQKPVTI